MKDRVNIIIDVIVLIFIIVLKFIFIDIYPKSVMLFNALFWAILAIISYKLKGIKRNKKECNRSATSYIIICILLYILLTFLSGMFFGFLKNSYSTDISSIIENIYSLVIMIIAQEYIKDITIRKKNNKYNLIILTVLFSIIDILLVTNISSIDSNLKIFLFITGSLIPIVIRNSLSSYIVYNFGIKQAIIYRIFFTIYPYIFMIYPNLGNYLNSVIAVVLPYLMYLLLSNLLDRDLKNDRVIINKKFYYGTIPLIIVLLIVISLVSGIFKYQIIAISSGSMEPNIFRGDAIIYEKIDDYHTLDIGDIIVYRHDGIIVIHRIEKFENRNGKHYYITKGDNNDEVDNYVIEEKDIIGIKRLTIKYIGHPALWFQELFD